MVALFFTQSTACAGMGALFWSSFFDQPFFIQTVDTRTRKMEFIFNGSTYQEIFQ